MCILKVLDDVRAAANRQRLELQRLPARAFRASCETARSRNWKRPNEALRIQAQSLHCKQIADSALRQSAALYRTIAASVWTCTYRPVESSDQPLRVAEEKTAAGSERTAARGSSDQRRSVASPYGSVSRLFVQVLKRHFGKDYQALNRTVNLHLCRAQCRCAEADIVGGRACA